MKSFASDLADSLKNPEFWALSGWLDIVVRYRQSKLGVFWLIAPAIAYIWGLGVFFASMQGASLASFVGHVAIGYTVFRLVSSIITESTTAFSSASSFIMDGHVRLTDFVLRVVSKALFYFAMSLPVVFAALIVDPDLHMSGLAYTLVSVPIIVVNVLWIGTLFALVGARFPDLSQFIGNVFMFAFLLTPIVWHAEAVPAHSIRGVLMRINPIFHMVEVVRAPILGESLEPLTFYYLALITLAGSLAASVAYRRYARYVPLWI